MIKVISIIRYYKIIGGRLNINKAFAHNFKLSAAAQMSLPLRGKVARTTKLKTVYDSKNA